MVTEPFRVVVRQRPQHDGVDHTEYSRIRADAESERDYDDGRKARALAQLANSVSKIMQRAVHGVPPTYPDARGNCDAIFLKELTDKKRVG